MKVSPSTKSKPLGRSLIIKSITLTSIHSLHHFPITFRFSYPEIHSLCSQWYKPQQSISNLQRHNMLFFRPFLNCIGRCPGKVQWQDCQLEACVRQSTTVCKAHPRQPGQNHQWGHNLDFPKCLVPKLQMVLINYLGQLCYISYLLWYLFEFTSKKYLTASSSKRLIYIYESKTSINNWMSSNQSPNEYYFKFNFLGLQFISVYVYCEYLNMPLISTPLNSSILDISSIGNINLLNKIESFMKSDVHKSHLENLLHMQNP